MRGIKSDQIIRIAIISVIALYLALVLLHLGKGFGFGDALGGPFLDFRAFLMCFGKWGHAWEFLTRDPVRGQDIGGMVLDLGSCT